MHLHSLFGAARTELLVCGQLWSTTEPSRSPYADECGFTSHLKQSGLRANRSLRFHLHLPDYNIGLIINFLKFSRQIIYITTVHRTLRH